MRRPNPVFVAAGVLAAYGTLQAVVGAWELASATPTTHLRAPLSGLLAVVGVALNLVAYGALGYVVAAAGRAPGAAARAGATAGALASLGAAIVNLLFFRDQLRIYLASYGVAAATSDALLVIGLALGALLTAGFGGLVAWLAALVARGRAIDTA